MSVSLFFGLPGCGKTTLLTYFAKKGLKDKRYKNIYCNINLDLPGLIRIEKNDFGTYQLENGLILYDEATIDFDSRDYKNFANKILRFYMLHRHYNVDIILFAQGWDTTDKRIRQITDRVFYVYKGIFLGKWQTKYYRIPYGIDFQNPKKGDGQKYGDIVQGYCKPNILQRIFAKRLWRPRYYKYFDSWDAPRLLDLPKERLYEGKVISVQKDSVEYIPSEPVGPERLENLVKDLEEFQGQG